MNIDQYEDKATNSEPDNLVTKYEENRKAITLDEIVKSHI